MSSSPIFLNVDRFLSYQLDDNVNFMFNRFFGTGQTSKDYFRLNVLPSLLKHPKLFFSVLGKTIYLALPEYNIISGYDNSLHVIDFTLRSKFSIRAEFKRENGFLRLENLLFSCSLEEITDIKFTRNHSKDQFKELSEIPDKLYDFIKELNFTGYQTLKLNCVLKTICNTIRLEIVWNYRDIKFCEEQDCKEFVFGRFDSLCEYHEELLFEELE